MFVRVFSFCFSVGGVFDRDFDEGVKIVFEVCWGLIEIRGLVFWVDWGFWFFKEKEEEESLYLGGWRVYFCEGSCFCWRWCGFIICWFEEEEEKEISKFF